MLYLIGGEMKSGKSLIARKMMEEKKIPFFSTDFLLWSIGDYVKKDTFSYFDSDSYVSEYLEPYLLKIISFVIKDENDLVIEGTHVTISLIKKVEELYPSRSKAVILGYEGTNENDKYEEIISYNERNSDAWYKVLAPERFKEILRSKINESSELKKTCEKEGIRYYNIMDIENEYKEVVDYLVGM